MKQDTRNTAHTPTPWQVEEDTMYSQSIVVSIAKKLESGHNKVVADCDCGAFDPESGKYEDKANADFIVRAVNAYDELLDAAKFGMEAIVKGDSLMMLGAMKSLEAAIAKAGGPTT